MMHVPHDARAACAAGWASIGVPGGGFSKAALMEAGCVSGAGALRELPELVEAMGLPQSCLVLGSEIDET
jgi:hypothetical protein